MARKAAAQPPASSSSTSAMDAKPLPGAAADPLQPAPATATAGSLATDPLPAVKVNPAHLAEIKTALDEIVKEQFTPSHLHALVHLALGYASVVFALGSALYPYVYRGTTFDESRPVLLAGVAGYAALQSLLWSWRRWVERGEVFRGKRRRVVKRIETDFIQVTTSTSFLPPPPPALTLSPHSRPSSPSTPSSPSSPSSPISPLSPSVSRAGPPAAPSSSPAAPAAPPAPRAGPTYLVHLALTTTSNGGKSLICRARAVEGRSVGALVDAAGGVERGELVRWLDALMAEVGVVGVEPDVPATQ